MGRPPLPAKALRHFFEDDTPKAAAQRRATSAPVAPPSNTTELVRAVARYDAAGNGRRLKGWHPPTSGPNRALEGLQKIRDRSRDSRRNDWASSAADRRWTTTLIGIGIMPRPPRGMAQARRKAHVELWKSWVKYADADCVLDFYGLQTLGTGTWITAGEGFARLRYRRVDSGFEIPLQVQLLSPEYVPHKLDADAWPGLPRGNRIRSGIEFDRMGKRVAFWVYKEHPYDGMSTSFNAMDFVRVPADEMIHIFEPLEPGQIRGVPDSAPVLTYIREMLDFRGTVLERQKLANLITGFIKKPAPTTMDVTVDPMTGLPIVEDVDGAPMVGLEPGTMQELTAGEDITWSNPPEAGTTYSDYVRTENLALAAGRNLPHELLTGDLLNISDRTLRIIVNDFRRFAEQRQWQIIVPQFCQKVRDAVGAQAAVAGVLPMSELKDWMNCEWAPDAWPDIHPTQDIEGRILEKDAGFRSRSSIIAAAGDDSVEVDEERKEDKEREDKFGLTPVPVETGPDGKPLKPGQKPAKKKDDDDQPAKGFEKFFEQINARFDILAATPAPLAPVTNNFTMPAVTLNATIQPTPIENKIEGTTVNVEPTPVQIENKVEAPTVNVAAPEVHITNEVQAGEVSVDVNLPDRKTVSDIVRVDGQIAQVTQIETTLQ